MTEATSARGRRFELAVVGTTIAVDVVVLALVLHASRSQPLSSPEAARLGLASSPMSLSSAGLARLGASPLYTIALHAWTALVGDGNLAARSLSALCSVVTVPVVYLVGRRLEGPRLATCLLLLFVVSPYNALWGTTVSPAAMVVLLVFALSFAVQVALDRPSIARLGMVVVLAAALAWTHAWGVAVLAAAIAVGLGRWLMSRRHPLRRPGLPKVLAALVIGSLAVLPLLAAGSPLLSSDGFGTRPFRPATLLLEALNDFHDGTGVLLYLSLLLVVLGVFGVRRDGWRVDLDLHTVRDARPAALVLVVAMGFVSIAGLASKTTLQPGAVAAFFPFFLVLAALGLSRFSGRSLLVVGAAFAVIAAIGVGGVTGKTRTEAKGIVDAIARSARGSATVLVCPAALGPGVARVAPKGVTVLTWPELRAPAPSDALDSTRGTPPAADPARVASLQAGSKAGSSRLYFVQGAVHGASATECGSGLGAVGGADPVLLRGSPQEDAQSEPMLLYTARR
jgi:4-amino-4-deoxy-L-arabinose transferase-like glycosyltransferase